MEMNDPSASKKGARDVRSGRSGHVKYDPVRTNRALPSRSFKSIPFFLIIRIVEFTVAQIYGY